MLERSWLLKKEENQIRKEVQRTTEELSTEEDITK